MSDFSFRRVATTSVRQVIDVATTCVKKGRHNPGGDEVPKRSVPYLKPQLPQATTAVAGQGGLLT